MKKVYKKLLKIKNPVLIEVAANDGWEDDARYRILYPDGTCQWCSLSQWDNTSTMTQSCFIRNVKKDNRNILISVNKMSKFDKDAELKIVRVLEIK